MTTGADEARDLVVTNTFVVRDVVRSVAFYRDVPSAAGARAVVVTRRAFHHRAETTMTPGPFDLYD